MPELGKLFPIAGAMLHNSKAILVDIDFPCWHLGHKTDPAIPLAFVFNKLNSFVVLTKRKKCRQAGKDEEYVVLVSQVTFEINI
jgi:hypothetical protein